MQEYKSRQVQIRRPAATVYRLFSDFTAFTPIIADKVEDWQATPERCSFRVQGMAMALRMEECEPERLVKIVADDGSPLDFTLWIQMQEVAPDDTRLRLVLRVKLNMMMRMMLGNKLETGIDQVAERIAETFNNSSI